MRCTIRSRSVGYLHVRQITKRMKRIKTKTLERSSYFATIAVAVVGICALLVGVYQFSETQKQQRETLELERQAKAVELFVKYNDLMREAAAQKSRENTGAVFWRNNLSIAITESIWNLTIGDSGWESTGDCQDFCV